MWKLILVVGGLKLPSWKLIPPVLAFFFASAAAALRAFALALVVRTAPPDFRSDRTVGGLDLVDRWALAATVLALVMPAGSARFFLEHQQLRHLELP